MLGSVFARKSSREGFAAAAHDMAVRTWRLYRTHLLTFFLFGGMIIATFVAPIFVPMFFSLLAKKPRPQHSHGNQPPPLHPGQGEEGHA